MADIEDIVSALRLINAERVGAATYYNLLNEYGSEQQAIEALLNIGRGVWTKEQALQEIKNCQDNSIDILLYKDEQYPVRLKQLSDCPPVLYVKGDVSALNFAKTVAIVGARSASINGCNLAKRIASELAESGVCVVSGMARGIDGAAHSGALMANLGSTVAVLGTGVDVIYPFENKDIYERIAQRGCIISEFPLGTQGNTLNFPRRNRIIAGLSQAVLVVEAGMKSGSLITADLAIKQGKTLFAVPGTPDVSRSSGTNYLIKKGAYLAEGAKDIIPYLKEDHNLPQKLRPQQKVLVFANNDVKFSENVSVKSSLVDFLSVDGVDIDELVRLSGMSASALAAEILELELNGVVRRLSGNKIALAK